MRETAAQFHRMDRSSATTLRLSAQDRLIAISLTTDAQKPTTGSWRFAEITIADCVGCAHNWTLEAGNEMRRRGMHFLDAFLAFRCGGDGVYYMRSKFSIRCVPSFSAFAFGSSSKYAYFNSIFSNI